MDGVAEQLEDKVRGERHDIAQLVLAPCPEHLDRVEVGAVAWLVEEEAAGRIDVLTDASDLMNPA